MRPATPELERRDTPEKDWRSLYFVGGISALLALTGTLVDIVITAMPGWEISTVPSTIHGWFSQFRDRPLLGLRNLDLLNSIIAVVGIPVSVALYGAHRRACPGLAGLALIVGLLGTAAFVTNNAALPMFELSQKYTSATTDAHRLTLEAAGEALLARGAHGSVGAFPGFFLSSLGTLLMGLAMLVGRIFSRATAWVGIVGIILLILYTIGATFVPQLEGFLMIIAMPGGLLMLAWDVMIARRLLQLSAARGA